MVDPVWELSGAIEIDVTNGVSSVLQCLSCPCPYASIHWTGEFDPGEYTYCEEQEEQEMKFAHTTWDLSGLITSKNISYIGPPWYQNPSGTYWLQTYLNGSASGVYDLSTYILPVNNLWFCMQNVISGVWNYSTGERQIAGPGWYTSNGTGSPFNVIVAQYGGRDPYFDSTLQCFAPGFFSVNGSTRKFWGCGDNDYDFFGSSVRTRWYPSAWYGAELGINTNVRSNYYNVYTEDGWPGGAGTGYEYSCGDGRVHEEWEEDPETGEWILVEETWCPDFQIDGYQIQFLKNTFIPLSYDEEGEMINYPFGTQETIWTVSGSTFDCMLWGPKSKGGTIVSPPGGWSKIEITKL